MLDQKGSGRLTSEWLHFIGFWAKNVHNATLETASGAPGCNFKKETHTGGWVSSLCSVNVSFLKLVRQMGRKRSGNSFLLLCQKCKIVGALCYGIHAVMQREEIAHGVFWTASRFSNTGPLNKETSVLPGPAKLHSQEKAKNCSWSQSLALVSGITPGHSGPCQQKTRHIHRYLVSQLLRVHREVFGS